MPEMDDMAPGLSDKIALQVQQHGGGGGLINNGPSFRRSTASRPTSMSASSGGVTPPTTNTSSPEQQPRTLVVIVHKDENGYGMKVSGDNPVFVQSVKEGGAAVRAGLQCGDMIIKVNGNDVTNSTHTEVVSLIRASTEVELTVKQRPQRLNMNSTMTPSASTRLHCSTPRSERITLPQPVDLDKKRQMEWQRVQTVRLMLENEQRYVDALRSELARCMDNPEQEQKILKELQAAERRINALQDKLASSSVATTPAATDSFNPSIPPCQSPSSSTNPFLIHTIAEGSDGLLDDTPPPLPLRNFSIYPPKNLPPLPPRVAAPAAATAINSGPARDTAVRADGAGSPSKPSMSGGGSTVLGHHRTKSNPDSVVGLAADASSRLIATESMHEIYRRQPKQGSCDVDSPHESPAGTPPPPYRPLSDDTGGDDEVQLRLHGPNDSMDSSMRSSMGAHIMSMEEDDTSDQELSHLEDHGPFKSLTKLWEHHAHLAVFMNYVISNSDPSSLLFYLVTDLYKEGNAKEMKRWAYEIHSSFLVPDAPLRLSLVDENLAKEIDDVLLHDSDKEEILRKVFRKARLKAKEELNELLLDFQHKRIAGLGTLYGPSDAQLEEAIHDKSKEMKIIETILVPKLEPYIADMEKECRDIRKFTTAAALGTVMGKTLGVRGSACGALLDRCPTFVSKDKTMSKARLLVGGRGKRINVCGHHFVAHTYYHISHCNHCGLIIWGIGPQGYQCTNCNFNVHRLNCVRVVDEACPGPMTKKDRADNRISKLMDRIRPERDARRKPSSSISLHPIGDRGKRNIDDGDDNNAEPDIGERGAASGIRNLPDRVRPDTVRESAEERTTNEEALEDRLHGDLSTHYPAKTKNSTAIINRSESVKERIPQKKRERRKTSDPNLSKTNDVDLESQQQQAALSYHTNSGSSSNSSLSTRSLESPCGGPGGGGGGGPPTSASSTCDPIVTSSSIPPPPLPPCHFHVASSSAISVGDDSDMDAEANLPDWTRPVSDAVLNAMSIREKSRQEIINELFHTERTHVRSLKVLIQLFFRPMADSQLLQPDQLHLLFQNLEEMLDIHSRFNNAMKARRKAGPVIGEISDILIDMFDGEAGDEFQRAASTFCAKQSIALAMLKELRNKNIKLSNFLADAESNPLCRRLQLQDLLPFGFQRLTKYPLLFEKLLRYSDQSASETRAIALALDRSRAILNEVNRAVAAATNHHRLSEIQRRLDKSAFDKMEHPLVHEFKHLDLREHHLIYEGQLSWQINRQKVIDVHVLLCDDVIVFLQKTDEKFVLKFYNVNNIGGSFCPIVKMNQALVRKNAVQSTSLFLMNTQQSSAQIYELRASSSNECDIWFRHLSDAADAYKHRNGRTPRIENSPGGGGGHIIAASENDAGDDQTDKTKEHDESVGENRVRGDDTNLDSTVTSHENAESASSQQDTPGLISQTHSLTPGHNEHQSNRKLSGQDLSPSSPRHRQDHQHPTSAEPLRLTTVESALINPSEVTVSQKFVLTAEPAQTPLERLRVQDRIIRRALLEKQQLVADLLHVPKEDFNAIAEIAGEPAANKDAAELVLAVVTQANQLTEMLNESLRLTEEDAVAAASVSTDASPTYSSQIGRKRSPRCVGVAAVPADKLHGIANSLNTHLAQLLQVVKEREEERDQLCKQLQQSREMIHALHEKQQKQQNLRVSSSCENSNKSVNSSGSSSTQVNQLPGQKQPQQGKEVDEEDEGEIRHVFDNVTITESTSERIIISDRIIEESVEIIRQQSSEEVAPNHDETSTN